MHISTPETLLQKHQITSEEVNSYVEEFSFTLSDNGPGTLLVDP